MKRTALVCVLPTLLTGAALVAQQSTPAGKAPWWNTFRGPDGTGVAHAGDPPVEWSEEKNIRWKAPLPGLGSSSPIVWQDRVYVTTAIETDRAGEGAAAPPPPPPERPGRGGRRGFGGSPPSKVHEFVVLCLDRKDGGVVWQTVVHECVPHQGRHQTGTFASNSSVTDGEHLFAFFGSRGLYCLDLDGEVKWSVDLGRMDIRAQFGEGSSPALFGDTIVVNWDHEGDSFIAAFGKATGEERWRADRDERTGWSTPLIVDVDGKPQVIVTAAKASRAYDLATGELVWQCSGMTENCIPTPIHRDGTVWLMSGFRGAALQAVRLAGAKGDLAASENVLWRHSKDTSYTPSALLYDDFLYFVRGNSGVLTCLDPATGKPHYEEQRLDGIRTIYSSPVGAAGRVYLTSREGVTKVFALGAEYEELATNSLDDGFDASAAIVGDELYLRGAKSLYCIAADGERHP